MKHDAALQTTIVTTILAFCSQIPYARPAFISRPTSISTRPTGGASLTLFNSNEEETEDTSFLSARTTDDFINSFKNGALRPPEVKPSSKNGKGDLYDAADLQNLLSTHLNIQDQLYSNEDKSETPPDFPASPFFLHDLVTQAISEDNLPQSSPSPPTATDVVSSGYQPLNAPPNNTPPPSLLSRRQTIRAIASDVDGTLLPKGTQSVPRRTRDAVSAAVRYAATASDCTFLLATGKSRKGAVDSLGPVLGPLVANVPGVFVQGLYCVDGEGTVLFERKLSGEAVGVAEGVAQEWGLAVVAYDGDTFYTPRVTKEVEELHTIYGEPLATLLPAEVTSRQLADYPHGFHKLLLMDDNVDKLNAVRPLLEEAARSCGACVTQALPTMLEWLPDGCSKGLGVEKVCEALGIDPTMELLALGDAENDVEMLQLAAIGVAMGDGSVLAKESADWVINETCAEGGAGAAIELFGFNGRHDDL